MRGAISIEFRHCDDYIGDPNAPELLRAFLMLHRMMAVYQLYIRTDGLAAVEEKIPSSETAILKKYDGNLPWMIYADHLYWKGRTQKVALTMASRFGDVGIQTDLTQKVIGYNQRVPIEKLSNFRRQI